MKMIPSANPCASGRTLHPRPGGLEIVIHNDSAASTNASADSGFMATRPGRMLRKVSTSITHPRSAMVAIAAIATQQNRAKLCALDSDNPASPPAALTIDAKRLEIAIFTAFGRQALPES